MSMIKLLLLFVLLVTDAFGAVTYPTLPRSEPDIRPASAVRTITNPNNSQVQQYIAGTDTNLCSGSPCGGVHFGDTIILLPGTTYTDIGALPKPTGTITNNGLENYVTFQGSGTCPAAGTQAIPANDPFGRTMNFSNASVITTSSSTAAISTAVDNVRYYRFVCVQINGGSTLGYGGAVTMTAQTGPGSVVDGNYPDHISFERVYVHCQYDFGCQHAVILNGRHIRFVDSYVDNAMYSGSGDNQAIYITCGSGPFLIQNNSLSGMGEIMFFGGGPMNQCPITTTGVTYEQPLDVTVRANLLYRLTKWKRDDATFEPQMDTAGTGTVSSSGTTITFASSQTGLTGKYIRGLTSTAFCKIASGSGTSWVCDRTPSPAFSSESWRYNSGSLSAKNCLESKGSQYVLIEYNTCYNIWKDGQAYDLTMTAREFGYIQDWTARYNLFYNTDGPGLPGPGDGASGNGFGPSAFSTARVHVHDNLWHSVATSAMTTLNGSPYYAGVISGFSLLYGQISTGVGGTITAAATTGAAVDFTASAPAFASWMDGLDIVYNNATDTIAGRGVITYVSATHITVNVSQAFPSTSAISAAKFAIGPTARVGTAYHQGDSFIIEHNGWWASSPLWTSAFLFQGYVSGITQSKLTNFVFRSNYLHNGGNPGSSVGGFIGDGGCSNGVGTNAFNCYSDSATSVYGNTVFFGPQVLQGNNASQYYTGALLKCTGPDSFATTCKTAFHDPDEAGGNVASGSVGFTNSATGNLLLTGTYLTAAHDGTQIGPDWATVIRRAAFTLQGVPYNSTGVSAVSGSTGVHAISGSGGVSAGGGCVRGLIAAFDSGC